MVRVMEFLKDNKTGIFMSSHLSNSLGGWNKRGGGAKVAKSINVEDGFFFGKN